MVQLAAGPSKRQVLKVTEKFRLPGPLVPTWQPITRSKGTGLLTPQAVACQRFRLEQVICFRCSDPVLGLSRALELQVWPCPV